MISDYSTIDGGPAICSKFQNGNFFVFLGSIEQGGLRTMGRPCQLICGADSSGQLVALTPPGSLVWPGGEARAYLRRAQRPQKAGFYSPALVYVRSFMGFLPFIVLLDDCHGSPQPRKRSLSPCSHLTW